MVIQPKSFIHKIILISEKPFKLFVYRNYHPTTKLRPRFSNFDLFLILTFWSRMDEYNNVSENAPSNEFVFNLEKVILGHLIF